MFEDIKRVGGVITIVRMLLVAAIDMIVKVAHLQVRLIMRDKAHVWPHNKIQVLNVELQRV